MLTKKHEAVEQFLKDVDDQILYQPMHEAINEELCWHIEDKAEMYMQYGLEEETAYEKAVLDMGEPSALGIKLNQAHHLRVAKPLLFLIFALTFLGIVGNITYGGFFYLFDSFYFLWGIIVLLLVTWKGYPLLVKYTNLFLKIFLIGLLILTGFYLIPRIFNIEVMFGSFLGIYSTSVKYGVLQLSIPMLTVILYRNRRNGLRGIGIVFAYEAVMILAARFTHMSDTAYVPIATMLIACTGIMLYMLLKKYMTVGEIKGTIAIILGTAVLILLFIFSQAHGIFINLQMFVNPHARASVTNAWDDSYNNVLIRELLSRTELFGEVQLSDEELLRYTTSQWYYEDGEGRWNNGEDGWISLGRHVELKLRSGVDFEIEDALPQHYLNNYRISYWIIKYGIIPALVPISLILLTQIVMFAVALKIRNRLGKLTALAGCMAFSVQNGFYFLGNFGFQFGSFGNLPFVSEGMVSITGTMVMAGLILSAYRFDTVVREERF